MKQLGLAGESSLRVGKLEGPQEVVGLLEFRSDGVDLVDKVSGALNSDISESLGDNGVGSDRDALLVDLSESTLVDKLLDGGTGRISVCDVRFDQSKHSDSGLVQSDESGVVELTKAEKLHDLLGLGGDSDNTANADDKSKLRFGRDEESTVGLGLAAVVDGELLGGLVFFIVLLGVGLELGSIGDSLFFGGLGSGGGSSGQLLLSGLLLQDRFWGLHGGCLLYCGWKREKVIVIGDAGCSKHLVLPLFLVQKHKEQAVNPVENLQGQREISKVRFFSFAKRGRIEILPYRYI